MTSIRLHYFLADLLLCVRRGRRRRHAKRRAIYSQSTPSWSQISRLRSCCFCFCFRPRRFIEELTKKTLACLLLTHTSIRHTSPVRYPNIPILSKWLLKQVYKMFKFNFFDDEGEQATQQRVANVDSSLYSASSALTTTSIGQCVANDKSVFFK